MQALREIYKVTSDTVTIQIPKKFYHKQVEVIVLPVGENEIIDKTTSWEKVSQTSGKKNLTARDLLQSELIGLWADRSDIDDSLSYARQLRHQAEKREI